MRVSELPIIGISMGDPGGSAEICAKTLALPEMYAVAVRSWWGMRPSWPMPCAFSKLTAGGGGVPKVSAAGFSFGKIDVLDLQRLPLAQLRHKEVTPGQAGRHLIT